MSEQQAEFRGWAKVEVMGHQSHTGYVETQAFGGTVLFRIDTPALPEEPERTLTSREWTDDGYLPIGAVVKVPAREGVSVLVGAGSIYRIIPCTEEAGLKVIRDGAHRKLMVVSLPAAQIAAPPSCCPDFPNCNCAEISAALQKDMRATEVVDIDDLDEDEQGDF